MCRRSAAIAAALIGQCAFFPVSPVSFEGQDLCDPARTNPIQYRELPATHGIRVSAYKEIQARHTRCEQALAENARANQEAVLEADDRRGSLGLVVLIETLLIILGAALAL